MKPEEKLIAGLRATGDSIRDISKELGVSIGKVAYTLKREEVKALVEEEYARFMQSLPTARTNIQSLIEQYDKLPDESKDKQRAWASSMELLRSAGILPGNLSQLTINNIQVNNNEIISPVVSKLLSQLSDNVVDINTS